MPTKRSYCFICLFGLVAPLIYFKTEWYNSQIIMSAENGKRLSSGQINKIFSSANNENATIHSKHLLGRDYQDRSKVKIVLILAYMHTGSTFLGSIFQQIPGSYYEFESLRSLQQDTRNGVTIKYMNGTERHTKGRYVDVTTATDAVFKMTTCQHDQLDISTLSRFYFNLSSAVMRDTSEYYKCINVHQWREMPARLRARARQLPSHVLWHQRESPPPYLRPMIEKCLPRLIETCGNASLRSIKFIRMSMEVAGQLLKIFPDIKIIHLTRDPRAMLDSQVRKNDMGSRYFDSFVQNTNAMCTRMKHDLDLLHTLKKYHPLAFYSMQYENFVQSPITATGKLLDFLGLTFTDKMKNYVASKTILAEKNSTERAAVWRHHISAQHLKVLDANCDQVYTDLGYIKYPSILHIRNLSMPTFLSVVDEKSL